MGDLRQVIRSEILPAKSCFHQQREKGKRRGYGGGLGCDPSCLHHFTSPPPMLKPTCMELGVREPRSPQLGSRSLLQCRGNPGHLSRRRWTSGGSSEEGGE